MKKSPAPRRRPKGSLRDEEEMGGAGGRGPPGRARLRREEGGVMVEYLCWNEDEDEEEDARPIEATCPDYAAEKWAEEDDSNSAEYSISKGNAATVCVKSPDGTVNKYVIHGKLDPKLLGRGGGVMDIAHISHGLHQQHAPRVQLSPRGGSRGHCGAYGSRDTVPRQNRQVCDPRLRAARTEAAEG